MHPYELKIIDFMKTISKQSTAIDDLLLKPASKDVEHYIRKLYEDDPARPFSLRLSSIGKPLCQLQMEQRKAPAVDDDWNFPLRMMYGGVIEGLTVSILRHAGINIEEEQTKVALELPELRATIPGTLDLVIDGKVWDVKSASQHSFKEKFASYESLKENDSFGYICQLFGYAKARGIPAGGWIVVDKSSSDIKVLEVPENQDEEMAKSLNTIKNNVRVLLNQEAFKRQFEDQAETFKKRFTGNKVLSYPCNFCKFKYSCWENLKFLPSFSSTAYDKPMRYYTQISNENTVS